MTEDNTSSSFCANMYLKVDVKLLWSFIYPNEFNQVFCVSVLVFLVALPLFVTILYESDAKKMM